VLNSVYYYYYYYFFLLKNNVLERIFVGNLGEAGRVWEGTGKKFEGFCGTWEK